MAPGIEPKVVVICSPLASVVVYTPCRETEENTTVLLYWSVVVMSKCEEARVELVRVAEDGNSVDCDSVSSIGETVVVAPTPLASVVVYTPPEDAAEYTTLLPNLSVVVTSVTYEPIVEFAGRSAE